MKKIISLILAVALSLSFSGCKKEEVQLANYELSLFLNDDMTLDCAMTYSFVASQSVESVYFSLYPNAFSEQATVSPVTKDDELYAYPSGKSFGKVDVFKVNCNGKELPFEMAGINSGTLKVGFESVVKIGVRT